MMCTQRKELKFCSFILVAGILLCQCSSFWKRNSLGILKNSLFGSNSNELQRFQKTIFIRGGSEAEVEVEEILPEKINIAVSTGAGSRFVDQRCQVTLAGTATVADLKVAVQEKLPAQPPPCVQTYFHQTQALSDDQILGELLEDTSKSTEEEEGEEREENTDKENKEDKEEKELPKAKAPAVSPTAVPSLSLLLDMVPPVKGPEDADDPACPVPSETKDKIKAYAANAASLQYATKAYFRYMSRMPSSDFHGEMMSTQLRDDIASLEEFAADLPVSELPRDPDSYIIPLSQRTGTALDRFRIAFSKQLNINWEDSIKLMFLLYLFSFGAIGAGKPILRLMIPAVIIFQIRFFKFLLKVLMYSIPNIPALSEFVGAHLSVTYLQIITLDDEAYIKELYGDDPPPLQGSVKASKDQEFKSLVDSDGEEDSEDFEEEIFSESDSDFSMSDDDY